MMGNTQWNGQTGSSLPPIILDEGDSTDSSVPESPVYEADDGAEYLVEDILSETECNGLRFFLIQWADFPLDECTWEPEENLKEEHLEQWEETKAKQDRGELPEFDVQLFNDAYAEAEAKARREHEERNAKRKKRGLPLTPFKFRGEVHEDLEPEQPDQPPRESSNGDEDSADGVVEQSKNDAQPSSAFAAKPVQATRQNRIFTYNPDGVPAADKPRKASLKEDKPSSSSHPIPTRGIEKSWPAASSTKTADRRRPEAPSITGYQRTARKKDSKVTKPSELGVRPSGLPHRNVAARWQAVPKPVVGIANDAPRKGFTAKKTGQASHVVSTNVFAGGKQRKPRKGLAYTYDDPTKEAKMFRKHRLRRLVELKAREKDDSAPDLAAVQGTVFEITKAPLAIQTSTNKLNENESPCNAVPNLESHGFTDVSEDALRKAAGQPRKPSLVSQVVPVETLGIEPPKKRIKSVRFVEEDSPLVHEPMDMDTSSLRSRPPTPPPTLQKLPRRLSLADYHSRNIQTIGKEIILGHDQSRRIAVTFSGIPKDADQTWLQSFLDVSPLPITHACLGRSVVMQINTMREQVPPAVRILCSGTVGSNTEGHLLDKVAENLRAELLGLYYAHQDFNLLIHPTKCEDFNIDGVDPTNPEGVTLKYYIFSSPLNFKLLIRPPTSSYLTMGDTAVEKERERLFEMLLGLRYDQLIAGPSAKKAHKFFLAFPETRYDELRSVTSWLQASDPTCQVFTNFEVGAWHAFLDISTKESGTIVIHESMVWLVRRFPALHKVLLCKRNYNVWCFSVSDEALSVTPAWPSVLIKAGYGPIFFRLFPTGKVILVSPSFMVSEPQRTLDLFKWFFSSQTKASSSKLVTACNVSHFLRDLAAEKSAKRQRLKETVWRDGDVAQESLDANVGALSRADVEATYKSWVLVSEWLASQEEQTGSYSEENSVIYADQCIDPNDEQSLVNWFGWWSLQRLDKYRKFYVVGSSTNTTVSGYRNTHVPSKLSRDMTIPKYSLSTVNDPETALAAARKLSEEGKVGGMVTLVDTPPSLSTPSAPAEASSGPRAWFESEIFQGDEYRIGHFLQSLDRQACKKRSRLFCYPVSWTDLDMADHFGDRRLHFKRINDWFKWPFGWLKDPMQAFNTYFGFFYTIAEDWIPENFPRGHKARRHVWLAAYRPVNAHRTWEAYKENEVIIWDVGAKDKFSQRAWVAESDLTWMQQYLIRYIREHNAEKNPGTTVTKIYLGGFWHPKCHSGRPVDITAEFLKEAMIYQKIIPTAASDLLQNGYVEVLRQPPVAGSHGATRNATALPMTPIGPEGASGQMEVDNADNETGSDTRIIFHPPRGSGSQRPSKCINHLFERARLSLLRDRNAKVMEYTFAPTMSWYKDHVEEGRGFEHIIIDPWETIFKYLGIAWASGPGSGTGVYGSSESSKPVPLQRESLLPSHNS